VASSALKREARRGRRKEDEQCVLDTTRKQKTNHRKRDFHRATTRKAPTTTTRHKQLLVEGGEKNKTRNPWRKNREKKFPPVPLYFHLDKSAGAGRLQFSGSTSTCTTRSTAQLASPFPAKRIADCECARKQNTLLKEKKKKKKRGKKKIQQPRSVSLRCGLAPFQTDKTARASGRQHRPAVVQLAKKALWGEGREQTQRETQNNFFHET